MLNSVRVRPLCIFLAIPSISYRQQQFWTLLLQLQRCWLHEVDIENAGAIHSLTFHLKWHTPPAFSINTHYNHVFPKRLLMLSRFSWKIEKLYDRTMWHFLHFWPLQAWRQLRSNVIFRSFYYWLLVNFGELKYKANFLEIR